MIVTQELLSIKRSEWECYTDTPDTVVALVNTGILEILNTTHNPVWAQKRIYEFFTDNDYDQYGFNITKVATNVINKYYNSSINRWAFLELRK